MLEVLPPRDAHADGCMDVVLDLEAWWE